jgi:outer membrane lipoprotein-sorting protein
VLDALRCSRLAEPTACKVMYTRGPGVIQGPPARIQGVCVSGLVAALAAALYALACTASWAVAAGHPVPFAEVISEMQQAYDRVDHYTATFLLQERIDRELRPHQHVMLKFKRPQKIYLRWLQGKHEGRQAIYPAGVDANELWVRLPLPVGAMTVSLDPQSPRARKDSRHTITDVGIGKLIDLVAENVSRGLQRGEITVEDRGHHTTFGRPSQRYILHFPGDPAKGYYCMTAIIDVDREYRLPVYAEIFDWQGQLVERYGYLDVRLNHGLTDADFDPKNPAYGF